MSRMDYLPPEDNAAGWKEFRRNAKRALRDEIEAQLTEQKYRQVQEEKSRYARLEPHRPAYHDHWTPDFQAQSEADRAAEKQEKDAAKFVHRMTRPRSRRAELMVLVLGVAVVCVLFLSSLLLAGFWGWLSLAALLCLAMVVLTRVVLVWWDYRNRRREAERLRCQRLIAHAETQHQLWLNGATDGIYGSYQPADLDALLAQHDRDRKK